MYTCICVCVHVHTCTYMWRSVDMEGTMEYCSAVMLVAIGMEGLGDFSHFWYIYCIWPFAVRMDSERYF